MELLELPGWRIEYDRPATIAAFAGAERGAPERCGCDPCRNWAATREQVLPSEFRDLLAKLGIPLNGEAEVYYNGRLEPGLHYYGAWYHFVGRVLFGGQECSPTVVFGPLRVFFHSRPVLLSEAYVGRPVVQLEVDAEVPWLSQVPESA